jgi:hypothetical protein
VAKKSSGIDFLVAVAGSLLSGFSFIGWAMASELIAATAVKEKKDQQNGSRKNESHSEHKALYPPR